MIQPWTCVAPVAVEEVLGVEEHAQARRAKERHRVTRHSDGFVECRPQRFGDVQVGGLGHDADCLGARLDEMPEHLVLTCRHTGPASGPERDECGGAQMQIGGRATEELIVLRVGARPPTLDIGHAEMVELLGYVQLVVDGQRHPFLLRPVAKGRVVDVDDGRARVRIAVLVVAGRGAVLMRVIS